MPQRVPHNLDEPSCAQGRPTLIFDTSAINHLADDNERPVLEAGIKAGFWFRLNGDSFGELVATTDSGRRKKLLDVCRRLLLRGDCLLPHDEALRELVKQYAEGNSFYWKTAFVRCREYEKEIACLQFIDEEIARKQRDFAREVKNGFSNIYNCARPHFQELFRKHSETPPDLADLINALQVAGGAFWSITDALYQKAGGVSLDEAAAREFVEICPPFRALLVALCISQYQRSIQDPPKSEKRAPGAFDLFMSFYLPYCDQFVTGDGEQQSALADVVSQGKLGIVVRSYTDFRAALLGGPVG